MAREVGASVNRHFRETARSVLLKYCFCQQLNLQLNLLAIRRRDSSLRRPESILLYATVSSASMGINKAAAVSYAVSHFRHLA
jgi:hypothetical protein